MRNFDDDFEGFEEEKDGFFIGHTPNFIKIKTKGNYKINEIYDRLYNISNVKPIKYYDSNDNMYAKVIKFGDKK